MADTYLSTAEKLEKLLLSSTKFWSLLSSVAVSGAVASFSTTHHYTNNNPLTKYIISSIIALHLLLFLSNPRNIKPTVARFFPGPAIKWALRITAMRFVYLLYLLPDQSVTGLVFVVCVWIDVIAIEGIVRPSIDLWVADMVLMVVVSRSGEMYGFSGRFWLVVLMCYPVIYMQIRLKGYMNEETKENEGQS